MSKDCCHCVICGLTDVSRALSGNRACRWPGQSSVELRSKEQVADEFGGQREVDQRRRKTATTLKYCHPTQRLQAQCRLGHFVHLDHTQYRNDWQSLTFQLQHDTTHTVSQKSGHYTFVRKFEKMIAIFKIISLIGYLVNLQQSYYYTLHTVYSR